MGVTILQKEMGGLSFKGGYEVAPDDVTNAEFIPDLVRQARQLEIVDFHKLGVYGYAMVDEQQQSLGKIIGVRWVDASNGDSEDQEYR